MLVKGTTSNRLSEAEVESRLIKGERMLTAKDRDGDVGAVAQELNVKSHDRQDYMTVARTFADHNPYGFQMRYVRRNPWVVLQQLARVTLPEAFRIQLAHLVLYWVERDFLGQPESFYAVPPASKIILELTGANYEKYIGPVSILYAHMKQERGLTLSEEEEQAVQFEAPAVTDLITHKAPPPPQPVQEPSPPTAIEIPVFTTTVIEQMIQTRVEQAIATIKAAFEPGQGAQTTIIALTQRLYEMDGALRIYAQNDVVIGGCLGVLADCFNDIQTAYTLAAESSAKAIAAVERMQEIIGGRSYFRGDAGKDTEVTASEGHIATAYNATPRAEAASNLSSGANAADSERSSDGTEGGDGYDGGLDDPSQGDRTGNRQTTPTVEEALAAAGE